MNVSPRACLNLTTIHMHANIYNYIVVDTFPGILVPVLNCLRCTLLCRVNWSGRAKLLLHPGSPQIYGRAPVCVRT